MPARLPEEDDRDVVDPGAAVRRPLGHPAGIRPEDAEADVVHREAIAGREDPTLDAPAGEVGVERRIAGSRPDHAGLEHPLHRVPAQQGRQPGGVILMRVAEDHDVDSPIPRRQRLVQRHEQAPGIRSAIHEEASTALTLQEDRIALPDVENREPGDPVWSVGSGDGEGDDRRDEAAGDEALDPVPGPLGPASPRHSGARRRVWTARAPRAAVSRAGAPAQRAIGTEDDGPG